MSVATASPPRSASGDEKPFPEYLADLMHRAGIQVSSKWFPDFADRLILRRLLDGRVDQAITAKWFQENFFERFRPTVNSTPAELYDRYFLWSTLEGRP